MWNSKEETRTIQNKEYHKFGQVWIKKDSALSELLLSHRSLRARGQPHIFPKIKTERYKKIFLNRCLFDVVWLLL